MIKMSISVLDKIKNNSTNFLKIAICINFLCFFGALIFFYFFNPYGYNDYIGSWKPAVERFLTNPNTLYEINGSPFKNLPELVFYFMVFQAIPLPDSSVVLIFSSISLIMDFICCIILYKIARALNKEKSISVIIAAMILFFSGQASEYYFSQIDIYVDLCLLASLYFFVNDRENWQFFFLGLSMIFKFISLFFVPLLLFHDGVKIKKIIVRLIYLLVPILPSIVIFAIYPHLIRTFIDVNAFASQSINVVYSDIGSITKFLTAILHVDAIYALIGTAIVMYTIGFYVKIKFKLAKLDIYFLSLFITMLVSPDFTNLHYSIMRGIFTLWMFTYYQRYFKIKVVMFLIIFIYVFIPFFFIMNILLFILFLQDIRQSNKEASTITPDRVILEESQ